MTKFPSSCVSGANPSMASDTNVINYTRSCRLQRSGGSLKEAAAQHEKGWYPEGTDSGNAEDFKDISDSGTFFPGLEYTRSMYQKLRGGNTVVIAVMGMTGSGKTTFIAKATGREDLKIGHSLTSCTRDVEVIETVIEGHKLHFIDTPGFSDTELSDADILQMIADYLATAYKNKVKLSGIIYLHSISETRMTNSQTKNLEMFRKLTGEQHLKNVILATSMWDKVTPEQGSARESELIEKFWKPLLRRQARVLRYEGSPESAKGIAGSLVANEPFYAQLQEEIGKDGKVLRETQAGLEMMSELKRLREAHQVELDELNRRMRGVALTRSELEATIKDYQAKVVELEKTLEDERKMNDEAVEAFQERIAKLEKRWCTVM